MPFGTSVREGAVSREILLRSCSLLIQIKRLEKLGGYYYGRLLEGKVSDCSGFVPGSVVQGKEIDMWWVISGLRRTCWTTKFTPYYPLGGLKH